MRKSIDVIGIILINQYVDNSTWTFIENGGLIREFH
jgi:hypothetical protein